MSDTGAVPLVEIENVEKRFGGAGGFLSSPQPVVKALNDVTLTVPKGEAFCLVGESGCGKSTLARTVIGLHPPSAGEIRYRGKRIDNLSTRERRPYNQKMQMIFQNPYASLNPRMTVLQTLEEPLRIHRPQMSDAEIRDKVHAVMRSVGNDPAWGERYPHEFSGGQRQRISIARALMLDPEFIVADEPISALDVSIQAQVLNVMMDAQKERDLTYLFITHDLSVVEHFGSQVAVMYLGTVCEQAETRKLFSMPRHPYTQALLSAIPKMDGTGVNHVKMTGEVPTAMDLPKGCVFHPRCPHAMERCCHEVPTLKQNGSSQTACFAVEEGRI
ncbi:ABC transporter ATP-binding protein [Sneathiella chinensis]|uniref:ABC transporter ATP-binding protein n=1 Tax=Sneathiella chinensis TaxID=349750 RepID=A0ABQ5U1T2_9PROT|nr:oligopeptide/dipeptide ABC transporter ATP-binding protein [Sneathiella chinensis]GLQ06137.1 ABC transporter ATP-binding protein [Sneathiella chinensis]